MILPEVRARGAKRFNIYTYEFERRFGRKPKGSLLDFGCGAGAFLLSALDAGLDAYGVEVKEARQTQFLASAKPEERQHFHLYDGAILPFPGNSFDLVYSWFVFEHVADPERGLREIVRIMKPGAILYLATEDARNGWEGHAQVPWPPFMPRRFTAPYLRAFGMEDKAPYIADSVFYVTGPQFQTVLEALGCEILWRSPDPAPPWLDGLYINDDGSAERIGAEVKKRLDAGEIKPPTINLIVWARKPRHQRRRHRRWASSAELPHSVTLKEAGRQLAKGKKR